MPVLSRSKSLALGGLFVAAVAALPSVASAQVIDINGGNSWGGWSSAGNAQSSGTWVLGSTTRTYNIYSTSFVLSASQTVGGTRLADGAAGNGTGYTGDGAASLFSGSWQAGDRILGMGIQYTGTSRANQFFFLKDAGGNNIAAASSLGAGDGQFSFNVGDTSSYIDNNANGNRRGFVTQYSIWNGFSQTGSPQEGNYTTPYGLTPTLAMPTRSFTVLDAGSTTASKSIQYFINVDAALRANGGATYGDGDFGPAARFGFYEAGASGATVQIFAIPAPGALALLGLAGVAGTRRRR
jgi:MYXO-CTERM domain-containing protein